MCVLSCGMVLQNPWLGSIPPVENLNIVSKPPYVLHVFFLGYVSAFYPFLLMLLTWLCVELHGRNFRPIVHLWRPFHGCFICLRRSWNTKSDLIDVFASFFLLLYSKILYQVILTFDYQQIIDYFLMDDHTYIS